MKTSKLTMLILMPAVWTAVSPPDARAQTITLRPAATVDAARVRLGQVAEVSSPVPGEADQLASLVVADAPVVGGQSTLALADLRKTLADRGVNRAIWALGGARECRITRVESAGQQLGELADRSRDLREGLAGPIVNVPDEHVPDSLAGCIRSLLVRQFQPDGGQLRVQFDDNDRSILSLRRPPLRFELAVKRVARGHIDVIARIYSTVDSPARQAADGAAPAQPIKTAEVRVRVELIAPVVVARRMINRDQIVSADDVHVVRRQVELGGEAATELNAVVGQQAKRVIRPDDIVGRDDLAPMALVRRNEVVTVWARSGGVLVKTVGRAMEEGIYGQKILVRNEQSRQPFYATVTGPATVQLDPTPVMETRKDRRDGDRQTRDASRRPATLARGVRQQNERNP